MYFILVAMLFELNSIIHGNVLWMIFFFFFFSSFNQRLMTKNIILLFNERLLFERWIAFIWFLRSNFLVQHVWRASHNNAQKWLLFW